ncbi:anthranilate synthase component I [Thalassobacillus sp. CUG 92003]|uniref:anthranilate synthase component I n=1 Tax=Thalassobacillus sp. CUG 92003 TaxID=2736641 RepID=UPI0015E686AF|nr:anthranilate synthase component I [Thalassobacillus sp. CUG 92003]
MRTLNSFLHQAETYHTLPISDTFYADTLTPIQMFQAVQDEAVYMLESQDPESPWANYSFIGLDPMVEIKQASEQFVIRDTQNGHVQYAPSLKRAFDLTLHDLNVEQPDIPLPFRGGAVGYMGYDAISDFEPIPKAVPDHVNVSNYHLVFCQSLIAYNHKSKETTFIHFAHLPSSSDDEEKAWHYHQASSRIQQLRDKLMNNFTGHDLMINQQHETGDTLQLSSNYEHQKFLSDVERIKEYIKAGDIFQAVLSQRFEVTSQLSGFQLYRVLRKVNPSPYMFYLNFDDVEVIGSSPERLLEVQNQKLEIHPIAGTRKRGATVEEDEALAKDLLDDEKEQAEHRMLVDLARNDVGRVAEFGSVAVPEYMVIGRFTSVMHIISKVTGTLRSDVHPIDALYAAFPAGTLSGAPKVRAMQILRELEPTPRHLYGGGILYLGFDGNIDSCITIRTMTRIKDKIYIQAGAGVVADSDPESEYQETLNKASALKRTIELAEEIFEPSREGVETSENTIRTDRSR